MPTDRAAGSWFGLRFLRRRLDCPLCRLSKRRATLQTTPWRKARKLGTRPSLAASRTPPWRKHSTNTSCAASTQIVAPHRAAPAGGQVRADDAEVAAGQLVAVGGTSRRGGADDGPAGESEVDMAFEDLTSPSRRR